MIGGMIKGSSVMNSIVGRNCGARSRTKYAAGTTISKPTTIAARPTMMEKPKVCWKTGV
jgi:hypothetical protein